MDKLDLAILEILKENGREKASAISQQVNLSVSAVIDRIKKMTAEGIIQGYTVHIDRAKMGQELAVLMEVQLSKQECKESFEQAVIKNPDIVSCVQTTGDYDYVLMMFSQNAESLDELQSSLRMLDGVGKTRMQLVLKQIKNE